MKTFKLKKPLAAPTRTRCASSATTYSGALIQSVAANIALYNALMLNNTTVHCTLKFADDYQNKERMHIM
jgi:hypothetical protein